MTYQIKYSYRTGSSFGNEDKESLLEYEWKDLEVAKEALGRIREHYKWYESIHDSCRDEIKKPKWHRVDSKYDDKHTISNLINLPMNNGKEIQFWAPWCGYFETLYGAEIVTCGEDMEFTIH